jgi:CRISPR-associated endonuclease/helicase Cas3
VARLHAGGRVTADLSFIIARHAVPAGPDGLSPLQARILAEPAAVRVFSAPTGAGKSHAFIRAAANGQRVLFIVPTRRLAQNLAQDATAAFAALDPPVLDAVHLWSSDETERQRQLDPRYRPWHDRMLALVGDKVQFIVTTPESVALMLLGYASGGRGTDPFGVSYLVQYLDHVVFDEFHSIDPRGFGLCAFVARLCAVAEGPRVTFLSATPVDIVPVLTALGIPAGSIAVGAEAVLDDPPGLPGQVTPGLRVLHGDVRLDFVTEPDMTVLLEAQAEDIQACLARKRQIVVIFDSLEELQKQKQALAAVLSRLGISPEQCLAINSIDDSAQGMSLDGLFVTDRGASPADFPVLIATSSVEMGVNFQAGMLVMDAGHDALSFVQRVGRVARADEPGLVVVRRDPSREHRQPWLRMMLMALEAEGMGQRMSVSRFLDIVLRAVRQRFEVPSGALEADDVPRTFRAMPQRAVWAACLFWHALERARPRHLVGQEAVLRRLVPAKVSKVAALLQAVAGDGAGRVGFGADWARAFLKQAETLRDIAPTVVVQEPSRRLGAVPLHWINRYSVLQAFPLVADEKGGWTLFLDRALHDVLRNGESVFIVKERTVLLPNGQSYRVPAVEAASRAVTEMAVLEKKPGTSAKLAAQLRAAAELVRLSGLIPNEEALEAVKGTAIL